MKSLSIVAACLLAAGAAQAAEPVHSPLYGELGYTFLHVKSDVATFKPAMLRGIVGYEINPNVAVEGMLGLNAGSGSTAVGGVDASVKVEHAVGLFLKPKTLVGDDVELFARIGVADTRLKASAQGASESSSSTGLAYGLGLNYRVTSAVHVGVDYGRYYDKNSVKADGLTLSVGMRF